MRRLTQTAANWLSPCVVDTAIVCDCVDKWVNVKQYCQASHVAIRLQVLSHTDFLMYGAVAMKQWKNNVLEKVVLRRFYFVFHRLGLSVCVGL